MWLGSAAVCINKENKILMVLQGAIGEELKWSIPSGGIEDIETFEECCIREVKEETGYMVEINKEVYVKESIVCNTPVRVKYFFVSISGGEMQINDPDGLIYDVQWKSANEVKNLKLSFPEDRELLLEFLADYNNL